MITQKDQEFAEWKAQKTGKTVLASNLPRSKERRIWMARASTLA